jgi:hypothetical protein
MAEVIVDTRATDIVAHIIATLAGATVNGESVFDSVGAVNDIDSFVRVANPLRSAKVAACGVVEGTIDQRAGNNADQRAVCRLPFEILIRFAANRAPGEGETAALRRGKELADIVKSALLQDKSRGGKADLVMWGGEVVNGITLSGTVRPVTRTPNEAFFTVSVSGAVCWILWR